MYLGSASSVLSSTTSNQFRIVVLEQLLVKTHVLFFSEDSIIGLEAVLFQKSGITIGVTNLALIYSF